MKPQIIDATFILVFHILGVKCSWEEWWTYDGISGPDYWGLLNPEWKLCNRGRRQSPVDIEPSTLLYDPGLEALHVDKHKVNGTIKNTGHSVVFRLDSSSQPITLHGGPLSYKYRVHEILLHYGRTDDKGSEHTVSGHAFPAELQVVGYNYQLYENWTDALPKTQGIVTVTLMMKLGNLTNVDLRMLTAHLDRITHKGQSVNITNISIRGLLPDTSQFMTYEGSTTMPGCHETVTWIILNKPVYISKAQVFSLRRLMQGDERNPKTILANNFRPPQPLYNRSVRTNIVTPNIERSKCFAARKVFYKGNIVERSP